MKFSKKKIFDPKIAEKSNFAKLRMEFKKKLNFRRCDELKFSKSKMQ